MKFYIYNDTLGFINIFGTRIEQGPDHDLKTVVLFFMFMMMDLKNLF